MAEYIEREAEIEKIIHEALHYCYRDMSGESRGLMLAKDLLQKAPAADVEPVRRGKWLKTDTYPHRVYCSECYKTYVTNEEVIQGRGWAPVYCTEAEFCPHCGAKMGGEENNA